MSEDLIDFTNDSIINCKKNNIRILIDKFINFIRYYNKY